MTIVEAALVSPIVYPVSDHSFYPSGLVSNRVPTSSTQYGHDRRQPSSGTKPLCVIWIYTGTTYFSPILLVVVDFYYTFPSQAGVPRLCYAFTAG